MAPRGRRPKLLAIVGPTASGKSDLALKIAKKFNGEIIAADSRTVYKGMDIGTAKPSVADQAVVPHWGIDLVEPGQRFNAFQFKHYAEAKASDIQSRGKLPILVGGTGLYIDAFLFNYQFDADGLANPQNPRHRLKSGNRKSNPGLDILIIGLAPSDEVLKKRIDARVGRTFEVGVVTETKALLKQYKKTAIMRSAGIAYKICLRLLAGEINKEEAIELHKTAEWQYARRQKTWFRRNSRIIWFQDAVQAYNFIAQQLT